MIGITGAEVRGDRKVNVDEAQQNASPATVPAGGRVRVVTGFYEGLEIGLDCDWLVIGRGRGADLVLAEPTISRAHAAIGYDGQAFFVQDLGSTNGTTVNGEAGSKVCLNDGDEIEIGRLVLRLTLP